MLSRQGKDAQAGALLGSLAEIPASRNPTQVTVASEARALYSFKLERARGDVCRHAGASRFDEALECYSAARALLERISAREFMSPLMDLLGETTRLPEDDGAAEQRSALSVSLSWRVARIHWLKGSEDEAVRVYEAALELFEPEQLGSCEHAVARYHLGLAYLARGSPKACHEQLRAAFVLVQRYPHPKLRRGILRALSVCITTPRRERAWLACASIGFTTAAEVEATKFEVEQGGKATNLMDIRSLVGCGQDMQAQVNMLPDDWVICSLCLAPLGQLVVCRFQVRSS